jgi:hypothetical protein
MNTTNKTNRYMARLIRRNCTGGAPFGAPGRTPGTKTRTGKRGAALGFRRHTFVPRKAQRPKAERRVQGHKQPDPLETA